MIFNKVIMNPPFKIGGKILSKTLKICPNAEYSILMPLRQYKTDDLFTRIKTREQIDSSGFNAVIQENCSIVTLQEPDTSKLWSDFTLDIYDQQFRKYYEWNRDHDKNIRFVRIDNKLADEFDIDTVFIEHARSSCPQAGNGFGPNGCGYKFNVDRKGYEDCWANLLFAIFFKTKKEKDNFSKWWYFKRKKKGLASQVLIGTGSMTVSSTLWEAIPQIDWENISESELWKKGEIDNAILSELNITF